MVSRKGLVYAAACAALTVAGVARADEATPAGSRWASLPTELTLTPGAATSAVPAKARVAPVYLDVDTTAAPTSAPATTRTPLMSLLDQVGVGKTLDDLKIAVYGHVEGSYTYSASAPPGNFINGRVFDVDHEQPELNQAVGVIERTVDDAIKAHTFDVGARFEIMYGTDARFIHALGEWDEQDSQYQWDVTQAYVDFAIPVGNGLRVRAGKFVTLAGQEVIDPTGNLLYSHSFLFGFAIPFTQTGGYLTYAVSDKLTVDAGVSRGWDTSLRDNNDTIDVFGRVTYAFSDATSALVTVIAGPDQPGDNSHWRDLIDVIVLDKVGDNLALAFNGDYAYEASSAALGGRTSAQWFGAAAYFSTGLDRTLDKNPVLTLNGRVEYFNDDKGVRTGFASGVELMEATLGLAVTPFPDSDLGKNLVFRPEVRFDYANKPFFDAGTDRYQFTAAVDAYYKF